MTLTGTNSYLVDAGPTGNGGAYLIDPGPADPGHLAAIRDAAAARDGIGGILLTHSHADHSAAAPEIDAPLLWGEVGTGDESSGFSAPRAQADPEVGTPTVGPFTVIPTPGHAVDHCSFVWGRVCFCGDLVLGQGSSIVPSAARGGSLADYLESLRRLKALDLQLMCPGHGSWIGDPQAKLDEYLEHRLDRERKLVSALEAGERSRGRLLDAAWGDVPGGLRPAAALAMQAHLEKLEAEGRLPEGLTD
jgi:glyoxylase-like metal-dependent hydrolase (beta-lactamase superfamily II)